MKAIFVVHYAGVGCEMEMIISIGRRHGFGVVEENIHGLYGRYPGRYLGTVFTGMSSSEQAQVIDAVNAFRC